MRVAHMVLERPRYRIPRSGLVQLILSAAEIYAEQQSGINDLPVLDQNLLHIIRERHRQRSSSPWHDWKLLRYNTRKAAMQRRVDFYAPIGRS
jgi:hypothetical protein